MSCLRGGSLWRNISSGCRSDGAPVAPSSSPHPNADSLAKGAAMRPVDEARSINARRRSSSTELHWLPRSNNGRTPAGLHEWAVVDRDLGDRDWAAVDPMRVRKSKGVRHLFTPAMYFWQRTRSHVWCESQEERWEVLWLDYGGHVERLWAQPLAITFGHGSQLSGYSHVPDFLAQFTDGSFGLLDVRPAKRVNEHARVQFGETETICSALGWRYKVLTGHDNRATANLDCLSASRHDRCLPTQVIRPGFRSDIFICESWNDVENLPARVSGTSTAVTGRGAS